MEACPGIVAINKLNNDMKTNPLTLSLGANKLVLLNGEKWISESDDLAEARRKHEALQADNDALQVRLMVMLEELERSARETVELKQLKIAAMDMPVVMPLVNGLFVKLADQKLKNLQLEAQLIDCKKELKDSYRAAIELKNSFESYHAKVEIVDKK